MPKKAKTQRDEKPLLTVNCVLLKEELAALRVVVGAARQFSGRDDEYLRLATGALDRIERGAK